MRQRLRKWTFRAPLRDEHRWSGFSIAVSFCEKLLREQKSESVGKKEKQKKKEKERDSQLFVRKGRGVAKTQIILSNLSDPLVFLKSSRGSGGSWAGLILGILFQGVSSIAPSHSCIVERERSDNRYRRIFCKQEDPRYTN